MPKRLKLDASVVLDTVAQHTRAADRHQQESILEAARNVQKEQQHRARQSEEKTAAERSRERKRRQQHREELSEEEAAEERSRDTQRKRQRKEQQSEEEAAAQRKQHATQQRQARATRRGAQPQQRSHKSTALLRAGQRSWDDPRLLDVQLHHCGKRDRECPHCSALLWPAELGRTTICCCGGRVQLAPRQPPPEPLLSLYQGDTPESRHFLHNIRAYNCAFQLASSAVHVDEGIVGQGTRPFRVGGNMAHMMGQLRPALNSSNHINSLQKH